MKYKTSRRVFWKGDKPNKTTVSLTDRMTEALQQLSEISGDSVPDLIAESLETYLLQMVKQNLIKAPKGEEANIMAILNETEQKLRSAK